MKTSCIFFVKKFFPVTIILLFIIASAFSQTAHAVSLPTIASAVIQDASSTNVNIVISGSNFDRFFDSGNTTADSTDLSHIHYNGNTPSAATMRGSVITATFPIAVGSYKSGGSLTIAAGTLENGVIVHNTSTLSVVDSSITDSAKPVVVFSDVDGDSFDATTSSPQTVKITFSEPVTIPTIAVGPEGGPQTVGDCGDANAATWCFDYTIPHVLATETITISDAQDTASSPNTMDSDSNHTFSVSPYENSLDIVGSMINQGNSQMEIIVPSTGPILSGFWFSGTTTAGGTDLSRITYNGVHPTSAVIDTGNNAVDIFLIFLFLIQLNRTILRRHQLPILILVKVSLLITGALVTQKTMFLKVSLPIMQNP